MPVFSPASPSGSESTERSLRADRRSASPSGPTGGGTARLLVRSVSGRRETSGSRSAGPTRSAPSRPPPARSGPPGPADRPDRPGAPPGSGSASGTARTADRPLMPPPAATRAVSPVVSPAGAGAEAARRPGAGRIPVEPGPASRRRGTSPSRLRSTGGAAPFGGSRAAWVSKSGDVSYGSGAAAVAAGEAEPGYSTGRPARPEPTLRAAADRPASSDGGTDRSGRRTGAGSSGVTGNATDSPIPPVDAGVGGAGAGAVSREARPG